MLSSLPPIYGLDLSPHLFTLRGGHGEHVLQTVVDVSISAAHIAMVVALVQVVLKRRDTPFLKTIVMFTLFLGFRGFTQLLAIWVIWHPLLQLSDWIRFCSTILSVVTAVVLVKAIPGLHRLPSTAQLQSEVEQRRLAEESAREKEERFRNFIENVPDYAMFILDMEGVVQTWNIGAERIKGYLAVEIIGQHFSVFYAPEQVALGEPEQAMRLAKSGGYQSEGWRVRKGGKRFWANVTLRPLYDSHGAMVGVCKITRDMTQSRETESKYQALLESAPDAILITDAMGVIQFANAQVEKLYGYSRKAVLGQPIAMLTPVHLREEYTERGRKYWENPTTQQVPGPEDQARGMDMRGLRRDGSEFSCEMSISPIETTDGASALLSIRDVTERKQSETRFRALLESAPDAMVIVNSEGRIELTNRETERLFGYTSEEMVGQTVELLMPQETGAAHAAHRSAYFAAPKQREMGAGLKLLAVRRDGSKFPVEISLSPLEGPKGTSVTAAIRDVTERKHAAEQLALKMAELHQSNEALEQFAHIASHDLQEPLRMVASYVQLLSRRYTGRLDADADEFIAFAVDGTQRMKRLIEDLLLYSRAGKGSPPLKELASENVLRQALANLSLSIEETGAKVTTGELPVLVASEGLMVQIFQNLVGNALKYSGGRIPVIHISAQKGEREWIFSIADNGIGIDSKYFSRIFLIFQRLHGREEYEGTGIGLAICQRILQQQGGRIWLESVVGEGSTFYFSVPDRAPTSEAGK